MVVPPVKELAPLSVNAPMPVLLMPLGPFHPFAMEPLIFRLPLPEKSTSLFSAIFAEMKCAKLNDTAALFVQLSKVKV